MFEDTNEYRSPLSYRVELLIVLLSAIAFYVLASVFNLFDRLLGFLRQFEDLPLDELLVTFVGLNFVFSILLFRHRRQIAQEYRLSRRATRSLKQERILLRTVIDHLPDYIFVKDRQGRFVLTNVAHARAVRATPEALIGKKAGEVFPSDLAAQFDSDDERIMLTNKPLVNAERTTVNELNQMRSVLTTKIPLTDSKGQIVGLVGISRDITDHKLKERQALELAQERERIKMMGLFTRDAAHDFRTPLATIGTSAYLLMRSPDSSRQREHVQNIQDAVTRLSHLLDGLTYMTRLDSSHELDMDRFDLNQLLRSVAAGSPTVAQHPNLRITLDLDETLSPISGAADELRDAFMHIIDNAVRFTPDGGSVTVQTRAKDEEVEIVVSDTGVGISPADLPHIFDRFFRTDRARSSETGGIGLGLSITRKIIELHHGRIEAESTPEKGSTFRVYLPFTQPEWLHHYDDTTRPSRD